jgi:drug/metabolite transporter (DMT)-like permease
MSSSPVDSPSRDGTGRSRGVPVHWVLLGAQICFGSLPVAGRIALAHVPADGIVITRMTAGAIGFYVWARATGPIRIARRDWPAIVACALLGVVGNQMLFMHGLVRSTATNAAVLGSTIPVFTALFALALGREPLRVARLGGIGVAMLGAITLAVARGGGGASAAGEHLVGNLMILGNSACYGLYLVVVRPLAVRYSPIVLIAAMFAVGTVVVAPFGVIAWRAAPPLGADDLESLAFLILVPTWGAYSLTQLALRHAEASLVASWIYLQPVITATGAMIFLGERPGVATGIAAAFIFSGVWLSTRARR